jgi:cell wall-associated NlpC family hydrolase
MTAVPPSLAAVQARIAEIETRLNVAPPSMQAGGASAAAFADALGAAGAAADSSALLGDGSVTGEDIAAAAHKYVGVPYVLGGTSRSGIDCSGLVQRVYADLGIDVPRLVRDQEDIGTEVPSLAEAKPGDLIVLNGGDHIGIYLGDNTVIHAPYAGRTVSVQKLWVGEEGIASLLGGGSLDSLSALLGGGSSVNSSTAQQLMAARAALLTGSPA